MSEDEIVMSKESFFGPARPDWVNKHALEKTEAIPVVRSNKIIGALDNIEEYMLRKSEIEGETWDRINLSDIRNMPLKLRRSLGLPIVGGGDREVQLRVPLTSKLSTESPQERQFYIDHGDRTLKFNIVGGSEKGVSAYTTGSYKEGSLVEKGKPGNIENGVLVDILTDFLSKSLNGGSGAS